MPARCVRSNRLLMGFALAMALSSATHAQDARKSEPFVNSNIDAQLMYELIVGEMGARQGDTGLAFQVMLNAARKHRDEQLFRRATELALQGRAGEQALMATRAWREAFPRSLEAQRYTVQLLIVLNRHNDLIEPLRSLISLTPANERSVLIAGLPRYFARTANPRAVATMLDTVLKPFAEDVQTRGAARLTLGRAWIAAHQPAAALELARKANLQDPQDDGGALIALEAMATSSPEAEALVQAHLRARQKADTVHLAYASVLTNQQRYADAVAQIEAVTRNQPQLAPPWLTLGALHLELKDPKQAMAALHTYIKLAQAQPPAAGKATTGIAVDDEDTIPVAAEPSLTRAWLLLAQAAEQQNDFKAAEGYLAKVDSPQRALEVQARRASLLAKQGKLDEARELIRRAPEKTENDAHAKVFAEAQLLRDAKQWPLASAVLADANSRYPDDVDLLYEQAMIEEKLNRMDVMERLLRRVIALKPEHQHAHNALGYSFAERNIRLPEAKELIQRALELAPGDPFITDSLGWVEYRLGRIDEAVRVLREAYRARPDTEIAAHLGEVLWASGQRDEARRVWREGRNRDSVNDVLRETLARLQVDL